MSLAIVMALVYVPVFIVMLVEYRKETKERERGNRK
jgi:hypothetical protein